MCRVSLRLQFKWCFQSKTDYAFMTSEYVSTCIKVQQLIDENQHCFVLLSNCGNIFIVKEAVTQEVLQTFIMCFWGITEISGYILIVVEVECVWQHRVQRTGRLAVPLLSQQREWQQISISKAVCILLSCNVKLKPAEGTILNAVS